MSVIPAQISFSPEDYNKLGLKKEEIFPWEDGIRTDGSPGTYEWWYFDTHLDDGSTLVVVFYTKPIFDTETEMLPYAEFTLNTAEGKNINKIFSIPAEQFKSSTQECNVQVGLNTFKGNLEKYTIHFEEDDFLADITITGTVPAWRPETGFTHFGNEKEDYFAWLPAIPQGNVEAKITIDGETKEYTGVGYHDHNWGNVSMMKLMHNWYWGRARIGEYTVISSFITSEEVYGYQTLPIFMIAKNNKILADQALDYLTFTAEDEYLDKETGKPVHNRLIFDYNDGTQHFKITYIRQADIIKYKIADHLSDEKKELAHQNGFDGAYFRFTGQVTLEKFENETIVERIEEPALWELMYFGKNL